jgi:hypothetical protein
MECPVGGSHVLARDVEGFYCERCLEPIVVEDMKSQAKAKKKPSSRADDAQITKHIQGLVNLFDKRAKMLGRVNSREHAGCMDALNNLLIEWKAWQKS